jgi:Ornithine cyclodeaminase/mu-crystallin family
VSGLELTYPSGADIDALALTDDEILGSVRAVLAAQGRDETVLEPRTGAVTAVGAEYLARRDARVLGHVGARGTAYWNVRLLCRVLPELADIALGETMLSKARQNGIGTALPYRS